MIFNSFKELDIKSKIIFGLKSLLTLKESEKKIRLQLGGELESDNRAAVVTNKAVDVLDDVFHSHSILLRIISWDKDIDLISSRLIDKNSLIFTKLLKYSTIYYAYYPVYNSNLIIRLVKSVIEFELGLDGGKNINCIYANHDIPAIVNIYDDRGMDIVTSDCKLEFYLKNKYSE